MRGRKIKWALLSLLLLMFSIPAFSDCRGVTIKFENDTDRAVTVTHVNTKWVKRYARWRWFEYRDFGIRPGDTKTKINRVKGWGNCGNLAQIKIWLISDSFNHTKIQTSNSVYIYDNQDVECKISGPGYELSCESGN